MDTPSDFIEPLTPGQSYYCNTEDSGYNTFTQPSSELPEISEENFDESFNNSNITEAEKYISSITPEVYFKPARRSSVFLTNNRIYKTGCKHSIPEENTDIKYGRSVQDQARSGVLNNNKFCDIYPSSITYENNGYSDFPDLRSDSVLGKSILIPTTPVKKVCKSGCNINNHDTKRPIKRNILVMHSLSCDKKVLQSRSMLKYTKLTPKYNVKPNQKIDIIKMLYLQRALPAMMKIFSYLSLDDIFCFTLVSQQWQEIWQYVSETKKRKEYFNYLSDMRESQENRMSTPKLREPPHTLPLNEIQNVNNRNALITPVLSPTKSPKTIRFKRYTTSSLDVCQQLVCVKCGFPAKITIENTGEEWAECISQNCSFQFCSKCKCKRHTGKCPFQYDLEGPSPSKRSRKKNIAGTTKSRKNLRRLL